MRWRTLLSPPGSGVRNMALDDALMRRAARTGEATLRIYGWEAPTLSLGRHQRARDCYDLDRARDLGIAIVRRPTGGRALLHHREITYSATLPVADARAARDAYEFVNGLLLDALAALGVGAQAASATAAIPPGPRPCFDAPAEREIVIGDRKLVGSAQWRHAGALLQHGSILVRDDQAVIASLLIGDPAAPGAAATLAEALGWEPAVADFAEPLFEALHAATGTAPEALPADERLAADCLALERLYADESWTWRR